MGVETATFIGQLSPSNPGFSDFASQGDDHLRLIKSVLQNTFPALTAPVAFATLGISISSAVDLADFLTKTALLADQTTVDAGTDDQKFVTSLKFKTGITNRIADQPTAVAGTDNVKLMTALSTAQAIAALAPSPSSYAAVTADTVAAVNNRTLDFTAAPHTAQVPVTAGFRQTIINSAASGDVTISGVTGTIDGLASRLLRPGDRVTVQGTGTNLRTIDGWYSYTSPAHAIALGATFQLAHGLGVKPDDILLTAICLTTNGGYAVGEELVVPLGEYNGFTSRNPAMSFDATNIRITTATAALSAINTSGAIFDLVVADWNYIVRARAR